MKTCSTCKQQLELDNFSRKGQGHQSACKKCHKEYRQKHYQKNKEKYIDKALRWRSEQREIFREWMQDKSCVDCGFNDWRALQFDHLRDKEFDIATKKGIRTLESLQEEIEKCDIVCANCHSIRTHDRRHAGMV